MFDPESVIEFPARLASTQGLETKVEVRWPTDEEWLKRARARKVIIRRPRAGVSETIPPPPGQGDVDLYEAIKHNGAPVMTAAEADKVLDALGKADVIDVRIEGIQAEVEMVILSGSVTMSLRIPTADEVVSFRRAAVRLLDLPFSQQEVRINPEAGARLFDSCGGKSGDYKSAIPVTHKDAAVRAVIDFVDRQLGPQPDEASF